MRHERRIAQTGREPLRREVREPLWRELLGEQLREIRLARGETLRGVASKARVSPQYLSELERGYKEASSEILAAIGAALDTTLLDLTIGVASRLNETSAPARSIGSNVFRLAA
ncbi:helix-turn-helix domain-containing protein [Conyzicola sp.]|uniref:helix-turn-helix domain-containing protein n=1 Tax=Conyzicola sp. TaxID=1969404 RepID=UPI0039896F7C